MGKQITFINARLIDPRVEMEKSGTLTINNGLIEKKNESIKHFYQILLRQSLDQKSHVVLLHRHLGMDISNYKL